MILSHSNVRRRNTVRLFAVVAALMLALTGCSDDTDNGPGQGLDGGADVGVDAEDDSGRPDIVEDGGSDIEDGGGDVEPDVIDTPDADADGGDDEDTGPVPLRIDNVTPPRGPVDGGTPFVIEGAGFTSETAVFFGSRQAEVTLIDGKLVGETPEGAGLGSVTVKLLDPDTGDDTLAGGFTYTATVEVTSVTPSRVPSEGGVEVAVYGRGFDDDTRVSFGGETGVRHTLIDRNEMRVVTPAHAAGDVHVRATNRDGTDVLYEGLTYFDTLQIDAVRPASGSTAGGDSVTVSGTGFENGMTVEFDGALAQLDSVNAAGTEAEVVTPAAAAGVADVRVETAAGDATLLSDAFYYTSDASEFSIAAVSPTSGPESGGIDVTLLGAGLDAAGLTVSFDGSAATVTDQGAGHATVTAPAHAPGSVDVSIDDGAGNTDTLSQAFSYVDDLWVDGVSPSSDDVAGGQTVIIDGEGFTGTQRVLFGGIAAQFTVNSDTEIEAVAPAHAAGTVDVVVERDIEATFVDGFTYTEELDVFGFFPVRGSIAGNTYVELRGRGLTDSIDVTFGGEAASSVETLDAQTLAVRTPPHPTASVDVVVTRGSDSVTADEQYTYFNPGSRFGGSWGGPIQGAVNVSVFQMGGSAIAGAHVQLSTRNDSIYQGITDQNGMITLSGPDVYGEQTVTAVAAEFSSATVQRVNAENITIFLSQSSQGDPPPGPPTATFQGDLDGLDKLKEPGPNEVPMALVRTTRPDPWSKIPDPGQGATLFGDGPYTLNSRLGDVALVAIGGLYNNDTDTFEPLAMGVERYLFASEGQTYDVDIDLDIALDQSLTVKLNNSETTANGQPDTNRVVPWMDFGFEGMFGGIVVGEGTSSILEVEGLPPLQGELSDVEYFVIGGSYTGDNVPYAESFAREVSDMSQVVNLPAMPAIARVTSPGDQEVPIDGLVSFQLDSPVDPDFYYVRVQTLMGATVWEGFLEGDATSFRFPDFPDFSHLPEEDRPVPYPGGTYQLSIIGISQQGTSINDYSYSNLSLDSWESYSVWAQFIMF